MIAMSPKLDLDPKTTRRLLLVIPDVRIGAALAAAVQAFASVDFVGTASEAVESAASGPPAVVTVDVGVPDMRCAHLLRALLARSPRCRLVVLADGPEIEGLRDVSRFRLDGFFLLKGSLQAVVQRLFDLQCVPRVVSQPVGTVIDVMSRQVGRPPSVQSLAKLTCLSSNHLLRRCQHELGVSIKDYLGRVQTEMARRLLRESDAKLDDIAERTGFCDGSHLSRVFVQHTGTRPGDYRRRHFRRASEGNVHVFPRSSHCRETFESNTTAKAGNGVRGGRTFDKTNLES